MDSPRYLFVDTPAQLQESCRALAGAPRYFIDTEFETGGQGRGLCLVQISAGADVHLIDAIRLPSLDPLRELLVRPDVEWVVHAGRQDVGWLRESLKMEVYPRLFDTQVAWGLLGPEYPVSLAYLLYRILGLREAKEQQAGDWVRRPLSPEQLDYAAKDVSCLPALRDWMLPRLEAKKLAPLIHDVSLESVVPEPPKTMSLEDFRNAWQLDAAGQAALRFVIEWHNGLTPAEKYAAPSPQTLFMISRLLPETGAELAKVKGVYWDWAKRHGDAFTGRLLRASASASADDHVPLDPPPYNTFERIRAGGRIRRAAAEICAELELSPELVFPDRLLRDLIAAAESGSGEAAAALFTGWRETLLRAPFLKQLGG